MGKGAQYERDLVNKIEDMGGGAMRCPTSGGGTDRDLPDVIARLPNKKLIVTELKFIGHSRKTNAIRLQNEEVDSLERFGRSFQAKPFACGRFAGDTDFYFWFLGELNDCEKSYSVSRPVDGGTEPAFTL